MDALILTACFGGFDELRPQAPQDIDVEWVCITDGPDAPEPWRTVHETSELNPRMAAKRYKLCPPAIARYIIWIDANMEVTHPGFARQAIAHIRDGVALHSHPRRDCIYDEAEASVGAESQGGKYDGQPIEAQAAAYRAEGHPEHAGLWACGTIAWDRSCALSTRLGYAWLAECARWSIQDQISFPVVCRRFGINPGTFSHPQITASRNGYLENRWLRIHAHS